MSVTLYEYYYSYINLLLHIGYCTWVNNFIQDLSHLLLPSIKYITISSILPSILRHKHTIIHHYYTTQIIINYTTSDSVYYNNVLMILYPFIFIPINFYYISLTKIRY